jgi:diguanylate cyclase (GGDEF)-like protein
LFDKQLNEAVARRQQHGHDLAVLGIDLDGFKMVNDTLGHAAGDTVLRHLATRLRHSVREGDRVARLGGDKFVIIQFGASQPSEAEALATRLIDIIKTPFVVGSHKVVIGASIGIAVAVADDEYQDADQLLRAADLAMYRGKSDGRGCFRFFEAEFDRQLQERRSLELALRAAVEDDALDIAYQPLVNLQTNRISGFEALSRWKDPLRGWVSPGDFIPWPRKSVSSIASATGFFNALAPKPPAGRTMSRSP